MAFLGLVPSLAAAQEKQGETATLGTVKRARAVRIPNGKVTVDGRLSEPEWKLAQPAGDFIQQAPAEGSPSTEPTEVRFLYDDANLYIGGMMYDKQPDKIVTNELKRDFGPLDGDLFVVGLDTFHDKRNSYVF